LEPRHIPHILERRFALTSTAYKYLDIGISVGPMSSVEILNDNKGNQIILPHATYSLQNVLTLRNSCNQPHLHHCRYKI